MAKLAGAIVTGRSVTRLGYTRNWSNVKATGKVSNSQYGGQLIEVETPKGNRSIAVRSFTGVIEQSGTQVYFSGGKAVRSDTTKIRSVVADVVLGKGHNLKVANAKF